MQIHREGLLVIGIGIITVAFVIILLFYLTSLKSSSVLLWTSPLVILLLLVIWFFRVPNREGTTGENLIIAPADGKIVVIEKTMEKEYFNDERIQVSIFMSPLNVHQNVYPISGEVTYTKYHEGKYLVAWHPKSSTLNERATVVVKTSDGTEILVRQIAGAVARRIKCYAQKGDKVKQNDELGFIKFGSRVDIFLPLNADITCELDQVTFNKQTVIAKI